MRTRGHFGLSCLGPFHRIYSASIYVKPMQQVGEKLLLVIDKTRAIISEEKDI